MAAGDAKHVKVDLPDGSTATVFRSESEGKAVLVTEEHGAAPSGQGLRALAAQLRAATWCRPA